MEKELIFVHMKPRYVATFLSHKLKHTLALPRHGAQCLHGIISVSV